MANVSDRPLFLGKGRGRGRGKPSHPATQNKNAWHRKPTIKQNEKVEKNGSEPSKERMEKANRIKESAKKFIGDEYLEDSSEDEEIEDENIMSNTLKRYTDTSHENDMHKNAALSKTAQYLIDSCRPGAQVCLICIASIKHVDAVWSCEQCFSMLHINCIQKWARDGAIQTSNLSQENFPAVELSWFCPKCRYEFKQSECPTRYHCFCGKEQDPKFDPWIVPHSCGQTCSKPLKPACGHECLLLCHPGPCPPCPKTVRAKCHCGSKGPDTRRCGSKEWSCGKPCGRLLSCGHHNCQVPCHSGDCPPCSKQGPQYCLCMKKTTIRPCDSPEWQCDQVCGKSLSCGFHVCEKVCHEGECGDCPRAGERKCPCGKTTVALPCTEDIPTCGDTCDKELECGRHFCTQKCHFGPCGTCRQIINKKCRCGKREKQVQCYMEYLCESKCTNMRQCQRHQCKRKCCDNNCPPCEQVCGRTLNCKNHKCSSPCHRGQCYPCPLTVNVKCFCGDTVLTLPCGLEKTTKPPKCQELCKHPSDCHHLQRKPHRCHYGDCPPCKQTCDNPLPNCDHTCLEPCHDNVLDQSFIPKAPVRQSAWGRVRQPEPIPIIHKECPPCRSPVERKCFGEHESQTFPCSEAKRYLCCRPCGRALACGNHTCELECHYVTGAENEKEAGQECQVCEEPCKKPRTKGCTHPCVRPCHPGKCLECKQMIKKQCNCQLMFVYVKCSEWTAADQDKHALLLSCKNQCPKNLPCGHRCTADCHPGPCPNSNKCNKKTNIKCPCKRRKKDFPCYMVQTGQASLECDKECEELAKRREEKEEEDKKKKEEEERRAQQEEIELFERNKQGKRRRAKKQQQDVVKPWWIMSHKREVLCSALAIALVSVLFYVAMN
ncbi:NF-X1-type zinc finger protein NFXL1-like [Actinia tenebrosa]|uniref:NF-X1-type zinc finger protein NFXL1-like n=1 Tax=Actinia tenebrosa TaxID=6105 RepID=A0A6P8H1R1_ACTTE|nr:NF-X1-type zinc finger protein NFXL1-like [Actinia tenebrosa]